MPTPKWVEKMLCGIAEHALLRISGDTSLRLVRFIPTFSGEPVSLHLPLLPISVATGFLASAHFALPAQAARPSDCPPASAELINADRAELRRVAGDALAALVVDGTAEPDLKAAVSTIEVTFLGQGRVAQGRLEPLDAAAGATRPRSSETESMVGFNPQAATVSAWPCQSGRCQRSAA
jgi:hypothetical protein